MKGTMVRKQRGQCGAEVHAWSQMLPAKKTEKLPTILQLLYQMEKVTGEKMIPKCNRTPGGKSSTAKDQKKEKKPREYPVRT